LFAVLGIEICPNVLDLPRSPCEHSDICVSNFATATLDLPVPSSQDNAGLLFAAFTENIPPIGTRVRMILVPRVEAKKGGAKNTEPTKNSNDSDDGAAKSPASSGSVPGAN